MDAEDVGGTAAEGIATLADVVPDADRTAGKDSERALTLRNNLAMAHGAADEYDRAIELHEETIAYSERKLGGGDPKILGRVSNLAGTLVPCLTTFAPSECKPGDGCCLSARRRGISNVFGCWPLPMPPVRHSVVCLALCVRMVPGQRAGSCERARGAWTWLLVM
jgi:hypothetical protein